MKSRVAKYQIAVIVFVLLALYPIISSSNPNITYLGIEQGLSNNSVRAIYQDRKGFMWFCTYDGLNRYDGYGFKVFRNNINDTNSLVHNITISITEDQKNNLWIATRRGASIYNPLSGKFTALSYFSKKDQRVSKVYNVVKDVKVDAQNNVLIGCEESGLLFAPNGALTATQIPFKNGDSETINYGVQAIRVHNGHVWVLVQTKGLCLLDYNKMKLVLVDSTVPLASCVEVDNGGVWMGVSGGIYYYNVAANTTIKVLDALKDKMTNPAIVSLTLDKNNLWIGTNGGGVNIYNKASNQLSYFRGEDGKNLLSSDAIFSIYIDKESRRWLGTLRGGVNIIDPKKDRFTTVAHDDANQYSLPTNFIYSFLEANDGNVWIGTDGKGLTIWNRKTNSFTTHDHIPIDAAPIHGKGVSCLLSDYKGDIWIASMGGVSRFNQSTKRCERFTCINPLSKAENKSCNVIVENRHKTIWAATLRDGSLYGALYRFNRTINQFEAFDTRLSDLFALYEDHKGVLWGGNLSQLVKIDVVNKQHQFYDIGYTVKALFEDEKGNFWIGTEGGGLLLFDRNTGKLIKRYTTRDGLSNNSVLTILPDKGGNLWMSTYNGLSKFSINKKTFTNYYQSDGLQSNEFHYNAALALKSGELLFGGIKGFNVFDPTRITSYNTVPNLVFTGLTINNKPIEEDSSFIIKSSDQISGIKLPYNEAVVSIDFTALEYSSPNHISYAYYLQGWDKGWNYTNTRTANYTHLEEGSYTFRVKSTNAEGLWNTKELSLRIIVLPPWYRTWWAFLFYASVICAIAYFYWQYYARQTRLKYEVTIAKLNAQMEHAAYEKERAEHERERLISEQEKEINEKKISFFTNISHEFRNPLTLIINPIKDILHKTASNRGSEDGELNVVYRNARRLLSLVDQLLLFRKSENDADKLKPARVNFYALCSEVYLCFVQQARTQRVEYTFECTNRELEIYVDREKTEIILYNLISNALKYTEAGGNVNFEVSEAEEEVIVHISDTGRGIPPDIKEKLFDRFYQVDRSGAPSKPGFGIGLYLVRHFTEQHKGSITYHSELGVGTTFTVTLLKGKDHLSSYTIAEDGVEAFLLKEIGQLEVSTLQSGVEEEEMVDAEEPLNHLSEIVSEKKSILVIDDDPDIRTYVANVFREEFFVYQAQSGEEGIKLSKEYLPDVIISDIKMEGISGIEFCKTIKDDPSLSHIPVILLTGETSDAVKLEGVERGADDYITKPFDKNLLIARVSNLLKGRNSLQKYFYNEITLSQNNIKISAEYKEFLGRCIQIVEQHLDDDNFTVKSLASEISMSQSALYKKVKSVSGQSPNAFIRFIRLRKAAELFISSDLNVNEVAVQVGITHTKHFREQFNKLFGINPSDYIKKFRKPFNNQFSVNKGFGSV